MVRGLPRLSCACPWQVTRSQHSPGRSSWCRNSSGPWHPTHFASGMAAHLTSAADRPWNCHHSPFRVLRTSLLPSRPGSVSASPLGSTSTAVCCARSTSNSSPKGNGRGSFFRACSYHGSSRRLTPATGRVRLTLPEKATSCSCASSACAIASESRRIASGTWTSVVDQEGRVSPCLRLARLRHGHACCKHERRHVDTDCL